MSIKQIYPVMAGKQNEKEYYIFTDRFGTGFDDHLSVWSTSDVDSNFPTGKFTLKDSEYEGIYLNADSTWSAIAFGANIAQGTYHIKGDQYTKEANPEGCPTDASYKYTFDGTNLKLNWLARTLVRIGGNLWRASHTF